jgi:hypothetical protein
MKPATIPVRRGTHVAVRHHTAAVAVRLQRSASSSGGAVQTDGTGTPPFHSMASRHRTKRKEV